MKILWTAQLVVLTMPILATEAGVEGLAGQIKRSMERNAGVPMHSHAGAVRAVRESVVTIEVSQRQSAGSLSQREGDQSHFDLPQVPQDSHVVPDTERPESGGSGVVLTPDGLVLTNQHVIENAASVRVRLRGKDESFPAEILGQDAATDLAVLRVKGTGLQAATFGNSAILEPGDVVLALGSPFGLEQTVTMGIVSAVGRGNLGIIASGQEDFIQTDAAINPGNSGGPLVDGKGRVVGINTARYGGEGIGLAVPVNLALKVATDLVERGVIQRGYLGVRLVDLTPPLAKDLGLSKASKGVAVDEVEMGSPAAVAGIRPKDVIVQIDGARMDTRARFMLAMAARKPGESVNLELVRQGKLLQLNIVLSSAPVSIPKEAAAVCEPVPGLRFAEVTQDRLHRARLPTNGSLMGVMVESNFPPDAAIPLLKQGEVVTMINGVSVLNLEQANLQFQSPATRQWMLKVVSPAGQRFGSVRATAP